MYAFASSLVLFTPLAGFFSPSKASRGLTTITSPFPLSLIPPPRHAGTTLKLVGIEDMGPELLLKRVEKEVIVKDINFRGAISDFSSAKKEIAKADYENLLIRYNEDDIYGDGNNFELAVLESVAEQWEREVEEKKAAAEAAAAAAAEAAEAKKPGRKKKKVKKESTPWVSAGSEIEIEEESIAPGGAPIVMEVFRKRREFGADVKLVDTDSADLWNSSQMECRPFKDVNFVLDRMEHDVAVQAIPETVASGVQATAGPPKNGATQYEPLEMVPEEIEMHLKGTVNTITTNTNEDGGGDAAATGGDDINVNPLVAFLKRVDPLVESALQQNEVFDIFSDDFGTLADDDAAIGNNSADAMHEYQSFTDLTYSKGKTVSCIDWQHSKRGVVAVSCTEPLSFEDRVEQAGKRKPGAVLIWNFVDPIHPQYVLEAPTDVYSFSYNPVNPNLIAGGLLNGQVCLWDTTEVQREKEAKRKGRSSTSAGAAADGDGGGGGGGAAAHIPVCQPKFVSELSDSHVFAVTDLKWLGADVQITKPQGKLDNPKTGACDFFTTTSADGMVYFWDIRVKEDPKKHELLWTPTYKIKLTRGEVAGDLAAIKFNFGDLKNDETTFFCSSMDGEVAVCDFTKPDNDPHPEHSKLVSFYHAGPVRSIERSPFFPDIIMSVGDWTFKIFKQGVKKPLFSSPSADTYLSGGCFSPTRPGVVFTAKQDGTLEIWDFLDRSHEASLQVRVNSGGIGAIKFWPHVDKRQQLLAVGDAAGVLHIMDLPRNLRRPMHREEEMMQKFLDRELDRVKDVEERIVEREKDLKAREEAEKDAAGGSGGAEGDGAPGEKKVELTVDEKAEQEYRAMESEFMISMGLAESAE